MYLLIKRWHFQSLLILLFAAKLHVVYRNCLSEVGFGLDPSKHTFP